nr:zinc finger, CCHC-type [Tanacetum cinerariifolium]
MTTSSTNNSVFRGFFKKQKLTGPNFIDWYRQLRIVLSIEDKLNYLEQPIPPALVAPAGQQVAPKILAAHSAWVKGSKEIAGLMLMTMKPEIQRNLEPLHAHEMLKEQEERQSVSSYVLKMKGYIDNLERLGHLVTLGLGVSLILISLRKEYDDFVQNYNMHSMGKTVNELHVMLKLYEQTLPKSNTPALNAIRAGKVQKGHWKRNCPQYLAELMKKKKNMASGAGGSGIFIIELNTILNRSWIYDIGCGTHICNTTQGLRASRKLKLGALSLYVRNGQREAVEAIGAFYLCLLSGLEIVLNNCHYAPSITRGVIFVSYLYEDGFVNRFVDNTIQHCRLGHISKKRIEKLQHDGLLDSSDLTTFEKCVSCMSGKMARKPYTHQVERAKDLLELIHTYVCGPFKIMSRQGASYFVTFTDDFSRYGYVYLLKHKHEVFETFKVFQKEVENQLGYPKETMGYSFYYPPENKVLLARNAKFLENNLIDQEVSRSLEDLEIVQEEDTHPSLYTSLNHEEDDLEIDEPQSDIVPIRSKWFFKKKIDMDGNVHIYKARFVAKGYTQTPGIDYEETFSQVADIRAIRILIDIAVIPMLQSVKTYLGKCFAMKDLEKILKRFCMENSKRESIPLQEKLKLSKSQGASTPAEMKRMQNVPYASANPGDIYWTTIKNILKYLRNTKDMFLVYGGDLTRELKVSCYTDAGYLTDADDLKYQTGYVFVLNGGAVDWKSTKQSIFATSSVEAEYIAAFDASKEAVWVRKFIFGLKVVPIIKEPISMYCDNT